MRSRSLATLTLLLAAAVSPSESPAAGSSFHPAYRLLDEDGRNVLDSGGAVSPRRTCGGCHDTQFIAAHSPHADVGFRESGAPGRTASGRAWDVGTSLYGRWNPLTYRLLSPPGDAVRDLGIVDWIRFYGRRHVGGGPAAIRHQGATALDPETGQRKPWDWEASGVVELNCFMCHLAEPDNAQRVRELEAGRFRWAATATLAGTGVVSRVGGSWRYDRQAFSADGSVKLERLLPQDPSDQNCGQCHGLVAGEADLPVLLHGCEPSYWSTMTTGQILSPQRISGSAINLRGKEGLTLPWDVHAERLVRCVDCHSATNNPAHADSRSRPDHLKFEVRRLALGQYLERPSHVLSHSRRASVLAPGSRAEGEAGCRGCHRAESSHPWLPFAERHLAVLSCNACHTPRLHSPARRVIDWTVVTLEGKPRTECRGVEGDRFEARELVDGYEPVLLPQRSAGQSGGVLAPYNLVSSWFWVAGDPVRPVRLADLQQAFTEGGAYRPEIVEALDVDGDSKLDPSELILDTPAKVAVVSRQLESLGLGAPRVVGEIQPYPIHHDVAAGEWATKDCQRCHQQDSRLSHPFLIAARVPGGTLPELVGDAEVELTGRLQADAGGRLLLTPTSGAAGLYVLGHDRTGWADWLGLGAVLGVLLGVSIHATLRLRWSRSARSAAPAEAGEAVYMYSAYERFWHWLQALAILLLIVTGLEIHLPQGLPLLDFPLAVRVHNVIGFVVLINALLAALYHLASGEIRQYLPAMNGFFGQAIQQARYYLSGIFHGEPHPFEKSPRRKLNPLQQATYLIILNLLLPLQVVTGILIWGMQRWPATSAWLGGLPAVAAVHAFGAWLFAAFLLMHVYLTTTGQTPLSNLRAMALGWERQPAPSEKGQ